MSQYDLLLSKESQEKLCKLAKEKGVHVDQMVTEIVNKHFIESTQITRWASKKGPTK